MTVVNWSVNAVEGKTSHVPVALAVLNNQLHMVQVGENSPQLYHSKLQASGKFGPNVPVEKQSSQAAPALAAVGNVLHLVYVGEHSLQLYHSRATIT